MQPTWPNPLNPQHLSLNSRPEDRFICGFGRTEKEMEKRIKHEMDTWIVEFKVSKKNWVLREVSL